MIVNINELELIGEGRHGKVYRLSDGLCVKQYKKKKYRDMEYQVLKHAENDPHFPKVYECTESYMIRDYFDGPNLKEYIRNYGMNKVMAEKILEIIDSFISLGFTRIDCRLPHIIVAPGVNLKVIDPTRNMSKKLAYPCKILEGLASLGYKDAFLAYTKELRPDYYQKWLDSSES